MPAVAPDGIGYAEGWLRRKWSRLNARLFTPRWIRYVVGDRPWDDSQMPICPVCGLHSVTVSWVPENDYADSMCRRCRAVSRAASR